MHFPTVPLERVSIRGRLLAQRRVNGARLLRKSLSAFINSKVRRVARLDESSTQAPEAPVESAVALTPEEQKAQVDKLVAEGKKAIALKVWEEGVQKYGEALDLMRGIVGEFDSAMAPLLLSYGKALFELAVSTQGALGKEELDKQAGAEVSQIEDESSGNLVESAEFEPEAEGEPSTEDAAPEAGAPEPEGGEEGGEDVDEPEDDYNAAWEVLDVARTIYSKIVEDGGNDDDKLNLAECYISLGDVSCETENFSQAVQDYTSALDLKEPLLPSSSRALASVHYQLASVLEFTPNRRSDALSHVEKALEGFQARKVQLESASPEALDVAKMSQKEKEAELGDVKALIGDLEAKIEELKAAPEAKDFVSESINHLLGGIGSDAGPSGSATATGEPAKVNDLSGLVKKKPAKKAAPPPPATNGNGTEGESEKRKAEEEAGGQEKKLKA